MKNKKACTKPKVVPYTQLRDPVTGSFLEIYTHGGRSYPTPPSMPHEVSIYGMTYKVYYHSKIYAEKKRSARLLGMVMFAQRIIFIEPGVPIHVMREALYHETAHVYIKVAQEKSQALANLTHQQVEDMCNVFGEAITDLARNNRISTS